MHGWSNEKAYQFNAYAMIINAICMLITGWFTDKYGPMRFLISSSILTFISMPWIWYGFTLTTEYWQDFILLVLANIIPTITCGACYFWYIDTLLTDPRVRTRIFGVAYNIGAVLFGGTAPFLGTFFISTTGISIGSILTGCWVSLLSLTSFIAYNYGEYRLPKRYIKQEECNEEQLELTAVDAVSHNED